MTSERVRDTKRGPSCREVLKVGCLVILGGLGLIACLVFYAWWESSDPLPYINKVTGLGLADTADDVHQFDNGQWAMIAHLRLTQEESKRLVRDHDFRPLKKYEGCLQGPDDLHLSEELPDEFRTAPNGFAVFEAGGCPEGNSWQALLVPQTGQIWFLIYYPDWGGDPPGCATFRRRCPAHFLEQLE